jgi:glycosyltransferase involved in cell wall biosynthesis
VRILVYAHHLEIGGSQTNAIDFASELRRVYNHEIVFYAASGPMSEVLGERGFRWIPAPSAGSPSVSAVRGLKQAIADFDPDVLHVWDYWQYINASLALAGLGPGPSMVVSDMISEYWPRILPKHSMVTFGTPQLSAWGSRSGLRHVRVLTPPVDVRSNSPGGTDRLGFRSSFGVSENDFLIVTVSRLERGLKGESIRRTIEVVYALQGRVPVRFILVGDGPDRSALEELAEDVNRSLGRPVVVLTGSMLDPRPAYEAADLVVGMGGSAMRGMSLGRPVLVCGASGFARLLTPDTADEILDAGTYGVGDSSPLNLYTCDVIETLVADPGYAMQLGKFSRTFCLSAFSLEQTSIVLNDYFREAESLGISRLGRLSDLFRVLLFVWRDRRPARRVISLTRGKLRWIGRTD